MPQVDKSIVLTAEIPPLTPVHDFNLVGLQFQDSTIDVDMTPGDLIWCYSAPVGAAVLDITVNYFFKLRYLAP